jgi:large subunit ribosomal protein L21
MRIRVPRLEATIGDEVLFDDILMITHEGETHVGKATIKGASVRGEVIQHGLEDKIVVFKYKRRKSERRKAGHRQGYTEVLIREILLHPDDQAAAVSDETESEKETAAE